jgi:thioredoxin-like negative regulator of GroEL
LAQGNPEKAIKAFLNDTQPNDMSEWYLALAYLKANQKKEAKSLLKTIAEDEGHDYQEEAEEAIGKLAN